MKLRRMEMENFRQFYGKQTLSFSVDPERNVTLLYGSNGSGKTTVLNAFTWALYGATTPGLADSDWLHNHRAAEEVEDGAELACSVRIEFEDEDKQYELERRKVVKKQGGDWVDLSSGATLHIIDESGRSELGNPEGAVNAILPARLHRFVFFDGERDIEHLAKPEAVAEIEDAIKTVLGLEVIERSIQHVSLARTELNRELSKLGDTRDQELNERIEDLEQKLESLDSERDQIRLNIESSDSQLAQVNAELVKLEESRKLQNQREEAESEVAAALKQIQGGDRDLDDAVRRHGFLAFVPGLLTSAQGLVGEKHERGQIPTSIKQQFVQDLIDREECICGTALPEGSREHELVAAWFEKAGRPEVEDRWIRLTADAKGYWTRRDELYRSLRGTLEELEGHRARHKKWDERRSEIDDEIKHVDSETVRGLEQRRDELKSSISEDDRTLGRLAERKEAAQQALKDAQEELASAREESEKAAVARRRVQVVKEAEDLFRQILEIRTQQTRRELDERIREVFSAISFKAYRPELGEDFRLTLSESLGGGKEVQVAKSTGESQILSLSFVGAMAERAREQYAKAREGGKTDTAGLLSFHGGVFPMVLDAVFGALDDTYQEKVAELLPDLAPQVIVLVSRGQAPKAIRDQLWPRAGRVAVCTLYTSGAEDGEEAEVETPAGRVPYRVPITDGRDRTEIQEVV